MYKLRHIWFILALSLIASQLQAQAWDNYTLPAEVPSSIALTDKTDNFVDFQTIGSLAPYYVLPDSTVKNQIGTYAQQRPLRNSLFQWNVLNSPSSGPASAKGALRSILNVNLNEKAKDESAYLSGMKFYSENLVAVNWLDTGVQYVSIAEQFVPNVGIANDPAAGGYDYTKVYVLPEPRYSFPLENMEQICKPYIDQDAFVPINLSGIGDFAFRIKIDYYHQKLTGGTIARSDTMSLKVTNSVVFDESWTYAQALDNYLNPQSFAKVIGFKIKASDSWGRYEITVTRLSDQISRKSLNAVNGKVQSASVADMYTIAVMPTTTNPKILHLGKLKKKK